MASPPISFGPPDQQWHFTPSTSTYDLSPHSPSPSKVTIQTSSGAPGVSFTLAPESTALVIVDMQNFFLHEKCRSHPLGLEAVKPTIAVIEKCRELGIQVIWLNWGLTDIDMTTMPAAVLRGFSKSALHDPSGPRLAGLGVDLGSSQGKCLFANSWNAEIYSSLKSHVKEEDIHCAKNRMSGLWHPSQPLWKTLVEEKKKTLLFTGVNTDQCVLGTLQDAYNAGWNCVLVDDCCATTTVGAKEVTVHNVAGSYGFVTDSEKIVGCKVEVG